MNSFHYSYYSLQQVQMFCFGFLDLVLALDSSLLLDETNRLCYCAQSLSLRFLYVVNSYWFYTLKGADSKQVLLKAVLHGICGYDIMSLLKVHFFILEICFLMVSNTFAIDLF